MKSPRCGHSMERKKGRKTRREKFVCDNPPCIHVVIDERRRIFKAFIEDLTDEGPIFIPLALPELKKACERLNLALEAGMREATVDETDYLARKYLGITDVFVVGGENNE